MSGLLFFSSATKVANPSNIQTNDKILFAFCWGLGVIGVGPFWHIFTSETNINTPTDNFSAHSSIMIRGALLLLCLAAAMASLPTDDWVETPEVPL